MTPRRLLLLALLCAGGCSQRAALGRPQHPRFTTPAAAMSDWPNAPMPRENLVIRRLHHRFNNGFSLILLPRPVPGLASAVFASSATPAVDRRVPPLATTWMTHLMFRATAEDEADLVHPMEREGFSPRVVAGGAGVRIEERLTVDELPRWLRTLDAVLRRPRFRPQDLAEAQRLYAEEQKGLGVNEWSSFWGRFGRLFYAPGDVRARSDEALHDAIRALDVEALKRRHRDLLDPSRAALVISGDVKLGAVMPLVARRFGAWAPHKTNPQSPPPRRRARGVRGAILPRSTRQSRIEVTDRAPPIGHPDQPAFLVLAEILGDMRRSALYTTVRERSRAGYGFHAAYRRDAVEGMIQFLTAVDPAYGPAVLTAITHELRRVRGAYGGLHETELRVGKGMAVEKRLAALDDTLGLARSVAEAVQNGQPAYAFGRVLKAIRALDKEAVEAAARRWLRPRRAVIQIVTPGEYIPAIERLGFGTMQKVWSDPAR